jgi:hypothetical protein
MKKFCKALICIAILNLAIAPAVIAANAKVDSQSIEEWLKRKKH